MKLTMVGAGGVGGYFGGRLVQAGSQIQFLVTQKTCKALRENGLKVESIKGDFRLADVEAFDQVAVMTPPDIVLVAVKSWQLEAVAQQIKTLLTPQTRVIPLLNGVEAVRILRRELGEAQVVPGMCRILSHKVEPGHVRHTGHDPDVHFGGGTAHLEALKQQFLTAGVTAHIHADMNQVLWRKFLFVVTMGTVGALVRAPVGVVRSQPATRALLRQSLGEILAVAAGHGVALPESSLEDTLGFIDGLPAGGMASMHRDLVAGRPSELDAWTGAVVRLGKEKGVATPFYDVAYASLLLGEMRARDQIAY